MYETEEGSNDASTATAEAEGQAPEVTTEAAPQQDSDGQDDSPFYGDLEVPEQAGPADEPEAGEGDPEADKDGGEQSSKDDEADPYADITLEKDAVMPVEALEGHKDFGKRHGLTADAVRELVQADEARIHRIEAARLAEVESRKAALLADPDLGGKNLKETGLMVSRALRNHPEVRQLLEDTGMKYDLHVARLLKAVGASSSEPSKLVKGEQPARAGDTTRDIWPEASETFHEKSRI